MPFDSADREGFWALLEPQTSWIHRQARRLGVPSHDADDVTQDVLLAVFHKWNQYDASRPLRPWLFAFVFREVSRYRSKPERRREVARVDDDVLDESRATCEEHLDRNARRQLVLDAMASIELDRRAVFILADIEETPVPDAALALGIPLNTAYSRLRIARAEFASAVRRLAAQRGLR